jgi:4-hydroxybenzoyl-CoA reductase subunit beta
MMRLPQFRYRAPRTIEEAAAWLAENPEQTMLLAGGTDLLPNMKRRQQTPATVVGLRGVSELATIRFEGGLTLGAGVTLAALSDHPRVRESYAGLWQAASQVATPHLRNMGTIGGNLCLDTRCTYYDQNYEWRKSIDFCMKRDGQTCWVATSSPKCLAVSSTDTAPMLQALGASITLISSRGSRALSLADLYANDGMQYLTKRPDEILTSIALPPSEGWRSSYWKLRRRGSFDFPVAAAAVAAIFETGGDRSEARGDKFSAFANASADCRSLGGGWLGLSNQRVVDVRIVLGAVASRPLAADKAASLLKGEELTDEAIALAAAAASEVAKPMDNTDFELVWRKKMVRSLVADALREVRGDDMRARRRQISRMDLLPVI